MLFMFDATEFTSVMLGVCHSKNNSCSKQQNQHYIIERSVSFPKEEKGIVQEGNGEIMFGANFPKVMFIVF